MEHGLITSVTYKKGVVLCNVQALRVGSVIGKVPVMKPYSGTIRMPKPGEKAIMEVLDDDTRFIIGYLAREKSHPDNMKPGEMTIQVDDKTKVALSENSNGNYDLNLSASGNVSVTAEKNVTVDAKQEAKVTSDADVTIKAPSGAVDVDGDTVTIDGASDVKIDGIDFDQHTHNYGDSTIEDTDSGGGSKSTTTKTTDPPQ